MIYHIIAFGVGILLDFLLGDPHKMPHPIRLIGRFIAFLEKKLNSGEKEKALKGGRIMLCLVLFTSSALTGGILILSYWIHPICGIAVEAVMMYYIMAARSLRDESMKVYKELKKGEIEKARFAVSMIVGRDTAVLDDIGITKAAVETVAENASDGVIAPMLYTAVGGPILGFFYKAANTMDSMVGYKNEKYIHFGRAAALFDDFVNYLPSRISAYLMMLACLFCGKDFSMKNAYRIHKRDARKHASPNSAQTESCCAGALGIRLAGNAYYFGKLYEKPFIGEDRRPVVYEDIKRANKLMLTTAILCAALMIALMLLIYCSLGH